jgi:hypothetical protein
MPSLAIVICAAAFIAAVLIAASDAQGAFIYFLALPVCALLLVIGCLLSERKSVYRRIIWVEGLFLFVFVLSSFIPPLRFLPNSVSYGVVKGFEQITGISPYVWAKQNSQSARELTDALKQAKDELTISQMSAVLGWDRLCIFGPYSTEEDAAKALGYFSATLAQSRVRESDSVSALVFANGKGTLAVIDVNRSVLDFTPLSRTCLQPADFPLKVDSSSGRKIVRR